MDFGSITYYDGQQLMARASDGDTPDSTVTDIEGAVVFANVGTTAKNIADTAKSADPADAAQPSTTAVVALATTVCAASEFDAEMGLGNELMLAGSWGDLRGVASERERSSATAACAVAGDEVGDLLGGDLAGDDPGRRGPQVARRCVHDHRYSPRGEGRGAGRVGMTPGPAGQGAQLGAGAGPRLVLS